MLMVNGIFQKIHVSLKSSISIIDNYIVDTGYRPVTTTTGVS